MGLLAATLAQAQTSDRPDTYEFDIAAQPLSGALVEFSETTRKQVSADANAIRGIGSNAVSGTRDAGAALREMLRGTGLVLELINGDNFVIRASGNPERPESSAHRIEETIVTARKREELLQEIPMSVTVFNDEDILRSNIERLSDYAVQTPNFSFQNNGNRSRTILSLRGVSDENVGGTGTAVGYYMDQISLNPTGGLRQNDMALIELERIEVLRGPQGTLFGRNTIGGAINLVSRKPRTDAFGARVTLGVERYDTYYGHGHLNIPISERVALLISGMGRESDGFIDNPHLNDSFGNSAAGGRVALRAQPVDDLLVDMAAMRNVTKFDGLQTIGESDFDAGNLVSSLGYMPTNKVDSELYSMKLAYTLRSIDLISLSAYNRFDRPEGFDSDGSPFDIVTVDAVTKQDTFSQELRLQSNDQSAAWMWTVGLYYAETEDDNDFSILFGPRDNPSLTQRTVSNGKIKNSAVFGETDIDLTDALTLTLGARYSEDDVKLVNPAGESFEGDFDEFTPKLGLSYQINASTLWYATAAKGYKPGGFDIFFIDDMTEQQSTTEYGAETAWTYETGVNAGFFDDSLLARATVFYTEWEDIQSVFFLPPLNLNTLIQNAGAAEIYGAELELIWYPFDGLTLDWRLGLLDSEYTDFKNTPEGDLTGNTLPYAPELSFSWIGDYRLPVWRDYDVFFRAEYSYRSSQEGRNDNNVIERQPSYDLLNLRTGLENARYTFTVYAQNALDEEYFTNRRENPIENTVTPGQPFTWGVSLTARF
ncbi:MAG: TonB-dependent receptor [Pseudomonadota bacterium]